MGGKGDEFGISGEAQFECQHALSFTDEGHLLMFDSRIEGEESRALELALDEEKKTATLINTIPLGADSITWGFADKLDESTYLINVGQTSDPDQKDGFYEYDSKTGKKTISIEFSDNIESNCVRKKP